MYLATEGFTQVEQVYISLDGPVSKGLVQGVINDINSLILWSVLQPVLVVWPVSIVLSTAQFYVFLQNHNIMTRINLKGTANLLYLKVH